MRKQPKELKPIILKRTTPRNPYFLLVRGRKNAGPMKDKRDERGGSKNWRKKLVPNEE